MTRTLILFASIAATLAFPITTSAETRPVAFSSAGFYPTSIEANPGDTISWKWFGQGGSYHSIVSGTDCIADGLFEFGHDAQWTVPLDMSGGTTIDYFCESHCVKGMDGVIHVRDTPITPKTIEVPSDQADFTLACWAAQDGDTIAFAAGTYTTQFKGGPEDTGGLRVEDKSITITGETNAIGSPAVIIYGSGVGFLVLGPDASSTLIEHVHFTNFNNGMIVGSSAPSITNCIFSGNLGAIVYDCQATLTSCVFRDNSYFGLYIVDSLQGTDMTMIDCVIQDNGDTGVRMSEGTMTLMGCTISGNNSTSGAGGLDIQEDSIMILSNTVVCGNTPNQISGDWTDLGGNKVADECPAHCPADINGDGTVDVSDLLAIIGAWGACDSCSEDVNDSGVVDVTDLLTVIGAWGDCE